MFFPILLLVPLMLSAPRLALADGDSADADRQERVEVTGSHIKRVDVEDVSPVETVTKKEIDRKGYDNLGDVVRDLGVATFGSGTVSGNSTTPGNADINLRGLGSDNTLVLLNGQRLPQDAISGTVDINLIPIAAVERIEILKDGASAIYGSDALGGVVNIITKKDFQGTEITADQTVPTSYSDGKRTNINLVNGINTEKLSVVTSVAFRYDGPIDSRNRDWSKNQLSMIGNPPSYANAPGGNDGLFMTQNCPPDLQLATPAGTFCRFRFSDYSEEAPQITQFGILSEAHYEYSPDVRLNARVNYVTRDAKTVAAPSPGTFTIPASSVGRFSPPGWDGTSPLDLNLRLTSLGTRDTDVTTNSYGALAGATIQLPKDWQADVTSTVNVVTSHLEGTSGFALISDVQNLMNTGAFNPFAAPGSQGDLTTAQYFPFEDTKSILTGVEAKASGDLVQAWAGPVSMAVGALINYADYYDRTDPQTLAGNVFGNAGSAGGGHRSSEALYTEASIPVVRKVLEIQAAGRFDHYSDFGSTINPKVGFLLHAGPSVLIRGSYGTGFRAPLLSELYAGKSVGFPSFIDPIACAANGSIYCQALQYQVTSGGNPHLKQETSKSYTLGAIFSPIPQFNVGADGFLTKISNMPGIDYNDMMLAVQKGVNPAQYGVIINRDPTSRVIKNIDAPLQNLSDTQELGIDITSSVTVRRFKLATEQNQLFYYKTEGFPGSGLVNKLGWNGLPRWRNTTSLDYMINSRQDVSLISRTIPGQYTLDKKGMLTPLTTFDVSYSYRTDKIGTFTLALINILGSKPPLDLSDPTGEVNYSLYDPNGRQVVVGYQMKL